MRVTFCRLVSLMFFFSLSILPRGVLGKIEYDSDQLKMKNSEQISGMVRKRITAAQKIQASQDPHSGDDSLAEPAALEQLKDALRIVLARPDLDGERANAFLRVRHELVDLDALEKALTDISDEAIVNLKSTSLAPKRFATYVVILENLMAELKPEVKDNPEFKKIIAQIRDADIQIPDKVKNDQLMKSMSKLISPSVTAAKILPADKKKSD